MRFRSSLVSKPLAQSVASGSEQDVFVLDNAFALIDEYICADLFAPKLNPCSRAADHTFALPIRADSRPGKVSGEVYNSQQRLQHELLVRVPGGLSTSLEAVRHFDELNNDNGRMLSPSAKAEVRYFSVVGAGGLPLHFGTES
jgi:hypothetical protein